jgi:hypothetical protein
VPWASVQECPPNPRSHQCATRRNAGNLILLVIFEEGDVHPSPWFFQPDPQKPFFVAVKGEKLVRRGPREYFMLGKKPDGSPVEIRLTAGSFHMEDLF